MTGTTEPEKVKTGVREAVVDGMFISFSVQETASLDALPVERARGITVKAHTTSLMVKYQNEEYLLNLIDTPGHVDFTYEVSRSLRACEGAFARSHHPLNNCTGAILLIDASQGVQAQTVFLLYLSRLS